MIDYVSFLCFITAIRRVLHEQWYIFNFGLFSDAPVASSMANSKTSNTLEKDLDLLASVPSPSSVSRKVSLMGSSEFKNILE